MYLMADTVAGTRKINAMLITNRLNIPMIVGVFKTGLQRIMINISNRSLGAYARYAHGFKLQIRHRTGSVLRKRLIDF